jgi:RimJ/RimL family protein N-acetyltransferase
MNVGEVIVRTPRLALRQWTDSDIEPFAAMNADPRVMEHFPDMPTREQTLEMVQRLRDRIAERGWGLWAVEVPGVADFIGFVGLAAPRFETHFTPCVEVGWRLAFDHWGKGYATEAARAALEFGFTRAGLAEIVSFTVPANVRSQAVMKRIGMRRDAADDFDHPNIPEGHPMRRHVLFRLRREQWKQSS